MTNIKFTFINMSGLGIFIFSFPFLHAFGISVWVPASFIIAIIMLLFHTIKGLPSRSRLKISDSLLIGTLLLGIFPFILFWNQVGTQNILYSAAWIGVSLLYFFWGRIWLYISRVSLEQIGKIAFVTVLFLSFAVIIEFIIANTTGYYLSDFLPFTISEFPAANVLGEDYLRPRGFAAEAGFTAVVFEALCPLALYYIRHHKAKILIFLLIALPGYFLLFSAASFISITIALLIASILSKKAKIRRIAYILGAGIGLVVILYINVSQFQWFLDQIIVRKLIEFSADADVVVSDSTIGRPEAYLFGLQLISQFPYGIGWGMISQMFKSNSLLPGVEQVKNTGLISMPLEVFVSSGLLGGVLFILFIIQKMINLKQTTSPIAPYLFVALTSVTLHHSVILEFWYPMFWFLLALSDYVSNLMQTKQLQ